MLTNLKEENHSVSLTESQKKLLEKYKIPEEYIRLISSWIENSKQDFLMVLSDLLQIAETSLSLRRQALAKNADMRRGILTPDQTPGKINFIELKIKELWEIATSLWRCVDEIMRNPKHYDIVLNRTHAEYALKTKNLPVVEMFLWARPEYFDVGEKAKVIRIQCWVIGGLIGAVLGLMGGCLGGIKESLCKPQFYYKLLLPFYALFGIIIGWSSGAVLGATLGYRTGQLGLSLKLAFEACYINPFHEPKGSKKRQEMDLKIEETLFKVSLKNNF